MLTDGEIVDFVRNGFVTLRAAVPPDVVAGCQEAIDAVLRLAGVENSEGGKQDDRGRNSTLHR